MKTVQEKADEDWEASLLTREAGDVLEQKIHRNTEIVREEKRKKEFTKKRRRMEWKSIPSSPSTH